MGAWIGAKPALMAGILAMVSLGIVGWQLRSGDGVDASHLKPSTSNAPGSVEADITNAEVARLDAAARQHPAVAAIAAGSDRVELMRAVLVHADTKDVPCRAPESCAALTYYLWDQAVGLSVTLSIATGVVVDAPVRVARPALTQDLRNRAIDVALRDADVRATIAEDAVVSNVVDSVGYGSCAVQLCAVVIFASEGDAVQGEAGGFAVQVNLNEETVVYAETANGVIDRRFL